MYERGEMSLLYSVEDLFLLNVKNVPWSQLRHGPWSQQRYGYNSLVDVLSAERDELTHARAHSWCLGVTAKCSGVT